jgi:hypothetical protein
MTSFLNQYMQPTSSIYGPLAAQGFPTGGANTMGGSGQPGLPPNMAAVRSLIPTGGAGGAAPRGAMPNVTPPQGLGSQLMQNGNNSLLGQMLAQAKGQVAAQSPQGQTSGGVPPASGAPTMGPPMPTGAALAQMPGVPGASNPFNPALYQNQGFLTGLQNQLGASGNALSGGMSWLQSLFQ